jgi:RHS repeat-associated protein
VNGYLYTYVTNESVNPNTSVYFDDFTMVHTRSTSALQVVQTTDYYPFGLSMAAQSYQKQTALDNDYLYNGKELQDEHNLGWLDYGARMYMPELGRWGVVDPLAEIAYSLTPYRYAFNNPIIVTDPDGAFEFVKGGYGEMIEVGQLGPGSFHSITYSMDGRPKGENDKPTQNSSRLKRTEVSNLVATPVWNKKEYSEIDHWNVSFTYTQEEELINVINGVSYVVGTRVTKSQHNIKVKSWSHQQMGLNENDDSGVKYHNSAWKYYYLTSVKGEQTTFLNSLNFENNIKPITKIVETGEIRLSEKHSNQIKQFLRTRSREILLKRFIRFHLTPVEKKK